MRRYFHLVLFYSARTLSWVRILIIKYVIMVSLFKSFFVHLSWLGQRLFFACLIKKYMLTTFCIYSIIPQRISLLNLTFFRFLSRLIIFSTEKCKWIKIYIISCFLIVYWWHKYNSNFSSLKYDFGKTSWWYKICNHNLLLLVYYAEKHC